MSWVDQDGTRHDRDPRDPPPPRSAIDALWENKAVGVATRLATWLILALLGVICVFGKDLYGEVKTGLRTLARVERTIDVYEVRIDGLATTTTRHEGKLAEHDRDISELKNRATALEFARRRAELPEMDRP